METARLDDMVNGWFVGGFEPTLFKTEVCEVAIKHYRQGDHEGRHMHKVATEITALIKGSVRMGGREWHAGDIIRIEPGEATDFFALTDAITVVVKCPGALNDKYVLG